MCGSKADIQSPTAEIRRGKKEERRNHTAPVYLFIARQSLIVSKFFVGYISAISKPIHFWFSPKLSAIQGLQSQLQPEAPHTFGPISKF